MLEDRERAFMMGTKVPRIWRPLSAVRIGLSPLSSTRGRITAGFSLLVLILVAVVATAAWMARQHRADLAEVQADTEASALLHSATLDTVFAGVSLEHYLVTGDEQSLLGMRTAADNAVNRVRDVRAYEEAEGDQEQVRLLNEILFEAAKINVGLEQMVSLRQIGAADLAAASLEEATPRLEEFWAKLGEVAESERREVSDLRQRADRTAALIFWLLVIAGAAGAVIGLAVSALVGRSILKPLSSLESTALAVADGKLDARTRVAGPRELARLGGALNSMMTRLEERERDLLLSLEELRERNRQLLEARSQAATDALTGLLNHRAFQERIREDVRRAEEIGAGVALIMMDIDGFKAVNDSHGHLAGDDILRDLARTIAEVVSREAAHRYGGDEFAVILPGVDAAEAGRLAERLRQAVERWTNGSGQKITVSLGIAAFPEAARSAEELIYGADAAMYWAKSAGKNRVGDWSKLVQQRADAAVS